MNAKENSLLVCLGGLVGSLISKNWRKLSFKVPMIFFWNPELDVEFTWPNQNFLNILSARIDEVFPTVFNFSWNHFFPMDVKRARQTMLIFWRQKVCELVQLLDFHRFMTQMFSKTERKTGQSYWNGYSSAAWVIFSSHCLSLNWREQTPRIGKVNQWNDQYSVESIWPEKLVNLMSVQMNECLLIFFRVVFSLLEGN